MNKLIKQFVNYPSEETRLRLQNYINKHPIWACRASLNTQEFLKANGFI
jgi:hypothetical protein